MSDARAMEPWFLVTPTLAAHWSGCLDPLLCGATCKSAISALCILRPRRYLCGIFFARFRKIPSAIRSY